MSLKNNRLFYTLTFILLIAAFVIRLVDLDNRPMHGDEAVNAHKLNQVMTYNVFDYDPSEYHGPTLYYLSWIFLDLLDKDTYIDLTESDLRLFSVCLGIGLVLCSIFLHSFAGRAIFLITLFLFTFSAPLVFYSRYFIHEMLFVVCLYLTFFTAYLYLLKPSLNIALVAGCLTGFLISTKETWLISLPALVAAVFTGYFVFSSHRKKLKTEYIKRVFVHIILSLTAAFAVITVFYSAAFTNSGGLIDFLKSVPTYLSRGTAVSVHDHPWYQYLEWLFFFKTAGGNLWTELIILFFVITGIYAAFSSSTEMRYRHFLIIIGSFSLIQLMVFSVLAYKTPWNVLTFYPGLLVMAAAGVHYLIGILKNESLKAAVLLMCMAAGAHFIWQSIQLNHVYQSDPQNPYVYAHPLPDMLEADRTLENLAPELAQNWETPVQVIVPGNDYWPLPWYLRKFTQVGWMSHIPESGLPAPVIITVPELYDQVIDYIYNRPPPGQKSLYVPLFDRDLPFRPGKFINIFVRFELLPTEEVNVPE